jgi:hypothetical protein
MGLFGKLFGDKSKKAIVSTTIKTEKVELEVESDRLDYDTHLKPATAIKKEQGEDKSIDYLLNLYRSETWSVNDRFGILSKAKGYIKKGSESNRLKIISEYEILLASNRNYKGAQDLANIFLNEKNMKRLFSLFH